ncbi:MAG TPA: Rid family hydrolase [bacterium]|nr:Rid family hydrolase [bacterium]
MILARRRSRPARISSHLSRKLGDTIEDICKLTIYVTDASYRPAVYAVVDRYFVNAHHCSTGVVVKGLATSDLLVEIDAFGVIDERNR